MMKHQITHSRERPYSCDMCNKSLKQKDGLKIHLSTQSGEHPYVYHICHKSFTFQYKMKCHEHIRTGFRPDSCNVCNKSFNHKSALKARLRIHNGEKLCVIHVINLSGTWVVWISINLCIMEIVLITVRYVLKHSDWEWSTEASTPSYCRELIQLLCLW
jgi:hypothetical protein